MADDINNRYKKAANMRLLSMMAPGGMSQPAPGTPNYSAIPLDPPPSPRSTGFGSGIANALDFFGLVPKAGQGPSAAPSAPPAPSPSPSPFPPFTGLRNDKNPLPPFQQPGQQAAEYMPPISSKPMVSPQAASVYGGASAPAPAPMPAAPQGVNAAYVPPPVDTYADMGGYGGVPRMQSPQEMYGHLNPTPSLEEIFRREYAANPGAFGKIG